MTDDEDFHRNRVERIRKWLRNKNVRQWRRVLLLLYAQGEPMHTQGIADMLQASHGTIYKVLRKMVISGSVKEIRERKKGKVVLTWELSDHGQKELRRCQKNKIIPNFQV